MTKRGKVLRDPHNGPGLLMIEGQQYSFNLEGVWKSETPPKPGLAVDVELGDGGLVTSISAVPESQIAKEQADKALAAAKEKSAALASSMVARFGLPALVAGGLLIISWFFLSAVSVKLPFLGKLDVTFWQILGYVNSSNLMGAMSNQGRPSSGIYGLLAILCLAGPFLSYFWKDKRAYLGGALPLVYMIFIFYTIIHTLSSAMGGNAGAGMGEVQQQIQEEVSKAVSLGMGTYLSLIISLYFAGIGAKKFLVAKGSDPDVYEKPQKAAA